MTKKRREDAEKHSSLYKEPNKLIFFAHFDFSMRGQSYITFGNGGYLIKYGTQKRSAT
jgi:hypothetical protein